MSRLVVKQNGQQIKDLILSPGKDWIVGRSSSCDLVLDGDRSVSRQHFKIFFDQGTWKVEVLSRYGELYHKAMKVQSVDLSHGTEFEVPPYDFVFENSESKEVSNAQVSNANAAGGLQSMDPSDKTFVGVYQLTPFLKVCDSHDDVVQLFKLEGHSWIAGRDNSSAIFIDNQKFSRRHFQIRLQEGAYFILDLGSSNGTLLNGEPVSTSDWMLLRSGDLINVGDWSLYFELRDSSFENKLQEVPDDLRHPLVLQEEVNPQAIQNYPMAYEQQQMPASMGAVPSTPTKKPTNWVRLVIYLVVVGAGVSYYLDSEKPTAQPTDVVKKSLSPFEKLTPQQQQYIRDTYRLADRLFREGRYEMARQEVAKIHQLIPVYEESKNLEKLAEVALQTKVDQEKAEAVEKEKLEMEDKIRRTVAFCKTKINARIEMKTIEDCLAPVIIFNPDHPDIVALKGQVEQIIADRTERKEKQAEYQALVHRQQILYSKAEALAQSGKPLDAITAYTDVVASKLPDPQNFKLQAKRKIASIQKNLIEQQGELDKEADQAYKKGDLKTAISTLKKAIDINPENETLKGRVNSMLSELRKQMQVLYQEGVLEESVGEVETAKTKWKKIIDTSLPEEDYYKKAHSKLKKYGAE